MERGFAQIADGRERWSGHHAIPRHCHDRPYAAVILAGGYEECGSRGRLGASQGDVLLHDAFDAHLDRFGRQGAHVLNLAIDVPRMPRGLGRIDDPDAIACAAERDLVQARELLRLQLREAPRIAEDWPGMLARELLRNPACRLDRWASEHGLSSGTLSRGFGKVFAMTPAAFRAEARARRAYALIANSAEPLACIAAHAGFADQAHMTRAIRALTGAPPTRWRRSNPFKTAVRECA